MRNNVKLGTIAATVAVGIFKLNNHVGIPAMDSSLRHLYGGLSKECRPALGLVEKKTNYENMLGGVKSLPVADTTSFSNTFGSPKCVDELVQNGKLTDDQQRIIKELFQAQDTLALQNATQYIKEEAPNAANFYYLENGEKEFRNETIEQAKNRLAKNPGKIDEVVKREGPGHYTVNHKSDFHVNGKVYIPIDKNNKPTEGVLIQTTHENKKYLSDTESTIVTSLHNPNTPDTNYIEQKIISHDRVNDTPVGEPQYVTSTKMYNPRMLLFTDNGRYEPQQLFTKIPNSEENPIVASKLGEKLKTAFPDAQNPWFLSK